MREDRAIAATGASMRFLQSVTVAVLVWAVLGQAAARAQTRPGVIRISGVEFSPQHAEYGPTGPGHVTIIWELLYNRRLTEKSIGHAQWVCTTLGRAAANCTGTFFLPKGKLVVAGAAETGSSYQLPVIGGTELYAGVRGTLTGQIRRLNPRTETLSFQLLLQA